MFEKPSLGNLPHDLMKQASKEDSSIKRGIREFLRMHNVDSGRLRLSRRNFIKQHPELHLVFIKFLVLRDMRNFLAKQDELFAFFWFLVEWFEDAGLEMLLELEDFFVLYHENHNNIYLQREVSIFMFHHQSLASEMNRFVASHLHYLVSLHLSDECSVIRNQNIQMTGILNLDSWHFILIK